MYTHTHTHAHAHAHAHTHRAHLTASLPILEPFAEESTPPDPSSPSTVDNTSHKTDLNNRVSILGDQQGNKNQPTRSPSPHTGGSYQEEDLFSGVFHCVSVTCSSPSFSCADLPATEILTPITKNRAARPHRNRPTPHVRRAHAIRAKVTTTTIA